MSKALHLIMVASCQAEGSKCINGIHPIHPPSPILLFFFISPLIYTCTDRWSCHCSGTKADDGVLNRLDKRRNLGVISQHQNLSHKLQKCTDVVFLYQGPSRFYLRLYLQCTSGFHALSSSSFFSLLSSKCVNMNKQCHEKVKLAEAD